MEWVLECSIWREGNWYVSHCEELEIASQRETVEEAIGLFFKVASYTEVMEYVSCLDPISPLELQGQSKVQVTSTLPESQKMMGEVVLTYAGL